VGFWEGGKDQDVLGGILQKLSGVAKEHGQVVDDSTMSRPDFLLIWGLGKDGAVDHRHKVLCRLGDFCQQIARKMSPTALPLGRSVAFFPLCLGWEVKQACKSVSFGFQLPKVV